MPPALNHRKSRAGCQRCKARKVKCDEARPNCSACARHDVECSYADGADAASTSDRTPTVKDGAPDPIELRLMHEYMAYTCETLTTAREFWKFDAPLLALKFRHVLDALFALSALHIHRQGSSRWSNAGDPSLRGLPWVFAEGPRSQVASLGETLATDTTTCDSRAPSPASGNGRRGVYVEGHESLDLSRKYFSRALEGHSASMSSLSEYNIKAAFVCANPVSFYSLFTLGEASDSTDTPALGAIQWFLVSRGAFKLVRHWHTLVGDKWTSEAGSMYGEPNLVKESGELFLPANRAHLDYLLLPVDGTEIERTDRTAYEDALSYLGLMHKGIVEGFDSPMGAQRRIIAMPSLMPQRFADLVEAHDLQSIVILAHLFAIMKLCETKNPWLEELQDISCLSSGDIFLKPGYR